jgi:hypothetical protein
MDCAFGDMILNPVSPVSNFETQDIKLNLILPKIRINYLLYRIVARKHEVMLIDVLSPGTRTSDGTKRDDRLPPHTG